MRKCIYIIVCVLFSSCNLIQRGGEPFKVVDGSNVERVDSVLTVHTDTIVVDEIYDNVKVSTLVDSVYFVPLETTDNSLLAYYTRLCFHKNRIYLMDDVVANAVFIFDMQGRFIKRIGDKGGAPNEFAALRGMSVDRSNDYLVLYDNRKRKMVYFTLDGEYIKNMSVPFRFCGHYVVLPSGRIVAATGKCDYNTHLGDLDEYRLQYTDSLGEVVKSAFRWTDNRNLAISYEAMTDAAESVLYYPPYTNTLYQVTDTTVTAKYFVTYKNYEAASDEEVLKLSNTDELREYEERKMTVSATAIAESTTHLYFYNERKDKSYTLYDRSTKKCISFRGLIFNQDYIFVAAPMYSYGEYLVTVATPGQLMAMRKHLQKEKIPISEHLRPVYDKIDEEDNPILVFLKMKKL